MRVESVAAGPDGGWFRDCWYCYFWYSWCFENWCEFGDARPEAPRPIPETKILGRLQQVDHPPLWLLVFELDSYFKQTNNTLAICEAEFNV